MMSIIDQGHAIPMQASVSIATPTSSLKRHLQYVLTTLVEFMKQLHELDEGDGHVEKGDII